MVEILRNGIIGRFEFTQLWQVTLVYCLALAGVAIVAYLLGSINSALIISNMFYHDSIRNHGSGNPGLTNMLRTFGKKAALFTLLGDLLKTAIAILIAGFVFGFNYEGIGICTDPQGGCYLAALCAVIGHIAPVYYRFKGGKGVLTTATAMLILAPIPFLLLLLLFIAVVAISKYVSLGSVVCACFLPVIMHGTFIFMFGSGMHILSSLSLILIAVLVVLRHFENLQRISEKKENKLSFSKKPEIEIPEEIEPDEGDDEE